MSFQQISQFGFLNIVKKQKRKTLLSDFRWLLLTIGAVLSHFRSVKPSYRWRAVFYVYTYKSDDNQKKVVNLIYNSNLSCCTLQLHWSPIDVLGLPDIVQTCNRTILLSNFVSNGPEPTVRPLGGWLTYIAKTEARVEDGGSGRASLLLSVRGQKVVPQRRQV